METSLPKNHEDHIAGKGFTSMTHYNLVHKIIPMPQAMKIPAAKAAVDKEWEKLEKNLVWNITKVRSKKEVIDEARMSGAKVHFASLMDICHLKNAELETKHQKYKGRVVLRGYFVKDDSGSYAVFTEQGSSPSQMTAAKSPWDIIFKDYRDAQDKQQTQYRLKPRSKWKMLQKKLKIPQIGMSRHLDSSYHDTKWAKILVQCGRPQSAPRERKFIWSSFGRDYYGKSNLRNPFETRL